MRALPLDGVEHVLDDVVGGGEDLVHVLDRQQRLEAERERVRPVAHLRLLRRRHAEHLGDHPERQREREVADDVHLASTFDDDGVEGVVDHRLHAWGELLDRAGGEHLLHQLAEPGVVGGIEVEDLVRAPLRAIAEDLLPELGAGVDAHDAAVLDAQAWVPQQADGVVVAEQRPEAERRLLDRIGGRQLRELGVRILREARFERVEGFRLTGHISHSVTRGCGEDEHDRGGRGP